jgi:hypothetical protein
VSSKETSNTTADHHWLSRGRNGGKKTLQLAQTASLTHLWSLVKEQAL